MENGPNSRLAWSAVGELRRLVDEAEAKLVTGDYLETMSDLAAIGNLLPTLHASCEELWMNETVGPHVEARPI